MCRVPKPVADHWINPRCKEHNPGRTRGIAIGTGGKPVANKDDKVK
jgi:hypothetical protein